MGMYYVWEAQMPYWHGKFVRLDLEWKRGFPPFTITCEPLRDRLPPTLSYRLVPMRAPLRDQMWSASKFDLFSPAARELIRQSGTQYEDIPSIVHGPAGRVITQDYSFVHILVCIRAVDWERSDVDVGVGKNGEPYVRHARRIVLDRNITEKNVPIFRLDEMGTAILASEEFRREWERRGLTGAVFRSLDPFLTR